MILQRTFSIYAGLLVAGLVATAPALPASAAATATAAVEQPAIQLGAYQALPGAESDWQRLSKRFPDILGNLKPSISVADLGARGVFHRLRAGPFPDQSAAKAACDALIAAHQHCLVTRMAALPDAKAGAMVPPAAALEPKPAAARLETRGAAEVPTDADPVAAPFAPRSPAAATAAKDTAPAVAALEAETPDFPAPEPVAASIPAKIAAAKREATKPALQTAALTSTPESTFGTRTPAKSVAPTSPIVPESAGPAVAKPEQLVALPFLPGKVQAPPPAKAAAMPKPERHPSTKPKPEVALLNPPRPATPGYVRGGGVAARQVATAAQPLNLEVNKGTLLRLSQPAATVFVADPDVADVQVKSPGLIYVLGKKAGETVLYAVDDHEKVLLSTEVTVSHNVSRLREALEALMPDANVKVASVDNSLVLTGTVNNPQEAEDVRRLAARIAPEKGAVINQLQVLSPNQINLRVRVAEMSRSTLKNFGINLDGLLSVGGFAFGIATGNPVIAAGQFLTRGSIAGSNSTNNNLFGSFSNRHVDINGLIDALGTEGLISVLAEPNLTALSGETASFLAGGEFPIPVPQNNNNVTIEFKKFGVSLAFTPTLIGGGRINLKVRPEVSQLSTVGAVQINNFSIPALTTRQAETTVELASGQSFAIAGLLQNNSQQDQSKLPGLGELPVLGPLFRSDQFRRNETELVIIVTPYIVRPVSAKKMASPIDGFVPPNDVERILGGVNYRQQLAKQKSQPLGADGQSLIGPTGFVLE